MHLRDDPLALALACRILAERDPHLGAETREALNDAACRLFLGEHVPADEIDLLAYAVAASAPDHLVAYA